MLKAPSSGWLKTLAAKVGKATPEGADIWQARSGRQEGVGEAEDSLESSC
jgi:hypothetical protein